MASSLASQLAGLAKASQQPSKRVRGRPSLLFDFQKAADVDAATVHAIGCEGESGLARAGRARHSRQRRRCCPRRRHSRPLPINPGLPPLPRLVPQLRPLRLLTAAASALLL
eukprot:366147-Chlamydomonas_euryale.AAC.12